MRKLKLIEFLIERQETMKLKDGSGESSEKVIQILMKRDGISRTEAKCLILECIDELEAGNDEAIQDVLGLEDDYIFDIL